MSKKWLFSCVFLCVFMLSTSPVVAQKGSLSLAPSPMSSPGVGEEFELLVNITGGQAVAGYQVTVAFDATALEYISSKNGDYLPAGAFAIPAQHQGTRVVLAATALDGESRGNGTLAVVTFKVKAVKASTVSLAEALLSNKLGQTASPQVTGAEILADDVDPYGLAEKVYIQHTKTLTRTDVLEVLPDVLYALKAPKVQPLLNDGSIKLIANNPDHLKTFLPDVDNVFIRLLKTDAQIKRLIRDANFQKVLQDPIAIDALVAWMTGEIDDRDPKESLVHFSEFSTNTIWNGEKLKVTLTGLRHGSKYRPGSKHKVIVTLTNRRTGTPVPAARLRLNDYKNFTATATFVTATFKPAVITTNKNGQAETEITLGKQPGNLGIFVVLKPEGPRVNFGTLTFGTVVTSVDGERLSVYSRDLISNTPYRPGSKHKVTFTVLKGRAHEPVPSIRLNLSYTKNSTTIATFKPAVITTDKNGQAETEITFGKQPGDLGIFVEVKSEGPWVAFRNFFRYLSLSEGLYVDIDGLVSQSLYSPGSKHKVTFTVLKGREPVPSMRISLSTYSASTTTATFRPAVITTDKNGQAETEITFGKKPGHISINGHTEIDPATRVLVNVAWSASVDGQRVHLKHNLMSAGYLPGSKHKWMLTFTNAQTGKPMPSILLNLSANSRTTTATFRPAVITTDKNGQAETEITFGKKPGAMTLGVAIPSSEVVFHYLSEHPPVGAGVDIDITLDGASGELSDFSSDHARSKDVSYSLGPTKTRKKLVVKTKNSEDSAKSVPYVNLVFNVGYQSKRHVTFEPKEVRTDNNGRAVTYITFGAGQGDVRVDIDLSREVSFGIYGSFKGSTVITLDGADEKLSSDRLDTSYRISTYEFGRKLVVEVKDARYLPDIVFKELNDAKGSVTFEPKEVRTDSNGRAETFITFGAGLRNVNIGIVVNVNFLDKNEHGANVYSYSDGNKAVLIKGLELNVKTSQVQSDFTLRKYLFIGSRQFIDRNSKHFELYDQGDTWFCGSTSARMLLRYYGVEIGLAEFNNISGFAGRPKIAITPDEMRSGLGLLPVKIKKYYGTKSRPRDAALREYISQNRPPIVLLRVDPGVGHHYVFVVGYDTKHNKFLIADPNGYFHWMPWKYLKGCWELSRTAWKEYMDDNSPDKFKDSKKDGKSEDEVWKTDNFLSAAVNWSVKALNHINKYTMLVPENAPPYHHLESYTFENTFAIRFTNQKWTREITVAGPIVHWNSATMNMANLKYSSEGNKITVSGKVIKNHTTEVVLAVLTAGLSVNRHLVFPDISPTLVVTAWYKPSSAAAPTLSLLPVPPGATVLLPNYPNPFNPETWIPYHLAEPADVTLTIYAIDGKVVRHLDLGHQAAGFYQSKSRAAYWDGRNDVGERVASGLYFYTLTAGEFAATQKMLIVK